MPDLHGSSGLGYEDIVFQKGEQIVTLSITRDPDINDYNDNEVWLSLKAKNGQTLKNIQFKDDNHPDNNQVTVNSATLLGLTDDQMAQSFKKNGKLRVNRFIRDFLAS